MNASRFDQSRTEAWELQSGRRSALTVMLVRKPPFRRFCLAFVTAALIALAATAHAQFGIPAKGTQVLDASALKPPPGARVAIVEFSDMECPMCGKDNTTLKQAAATYKIPWIRHDFPLRQHLWSFQAAVNARWLDTKSKQLGDDYRDAVFASQSSIFNLSALNEFTQKFAQSHGITFPFAIDPQGKLAADVKADYALGQSIGIDHTPTVWIVTEHSKGAPFIEIPSNMENLYQIIGRALADTKDAAPPPKTQKKPAKH
jgi:protein-disulfide isomerase